MKFEIERASNLWPVSQERPPVEGAVFSRIEGRPVWTIEINSLDEGIAG